MADPRKLPAIALCILAAWGIALTAFSAEPAYELDVRYDVERRSLDGSVELTVTPTAPTLYLSLLANLERDRNPHLSARAVDAQYPFGFETSETTVLTVTSIAGETETALDFRLLAFPPSWQTYSLEAGVLAIDLPGSLVEAEAPLTVRIEFVTDIPRNTIGDQGMTAGILTWRFGWFPTLLPEQDEIVEADGAVAYAERSAFPLAFSWARFEANVTVPVEMDVLSGADTVDVLHLEESDEPSDEKTVRLVFDSPARSLALAIGSDYGRYTLQGPTPIEAAYLPGHEEEARFLATLAQDILTEFEARYGPYPRSTLTIVENPNDNGLSLAADGIVWLSRRFFTHRDILVSGALNRLAEFVLAHEIAHQWVGLGTGIDLDAEAWLSEGLAQYLAISYFEDRYGAFGPNVFDFDAPGVLENLAKRQFGFFNLREHFIELPFVITQYVGFDEALVKPTENVRFSNVTDVRLYDKGYLVARAIAAAIGEDAFERGIRRAIEERRADFLDARTFQAMLEEEAGQSLDAFFDTWVFGPGTVDYAVAIASRERDEGEHVTRVRITREGGTPQPVDVEVTLRSGATTRQSWDGEAAFGELAFCTPSWVVRATVDPDHRLPDRDRLNNNAPVKVVGGTNEAAYPLDAYILAANAENGGIVLSHLDRLRISIANGSASAQIKLGRHVGLAAVASSAGDRLAGGLAATYTQYAQPETGSAATYWEPDVAFAIGVQRRFIGEEPLWLLGLDVVDYPSFSSTSTRTLALDLTPAGSGRLSIGGTGELRLFPGTYLVNGATLSLGIGTPPEPLRARLHALHSFSPPSSTLHELIVDVGIDVAVLEELPFNLINVAMVDRMRSRIFLTGGIGWTTLGEFGTTTPYIEAGIEQIFDLSTLGGLMTFRAHVGVTTPVLGRGISVFYVRLSL